MQQRKRWRLVVGLVLLVGALASTGSAVVALRTGHETVAAALAVAAGGAVLALWLLLLSVHLVGNTDRR